MQTPRSVVGQAASTVDPLGCSQFSHPWRCAITSSPLPSKASWNYADEWLDESEQIRAARDRAGELGCTPVAPSTAHALRVLAKAINAENVVEVGTGAGVSGAALLSGMSAEGVLTSIDNEAEVQRLARETLNNLGYDHIRARLITGRALDVLPRLTDGAYDLVFIDGDRTEYPAALSLAKRLLREGGLVAFDNMLADGSIGDSSSRNPEAVALRDVTHALRDDDNWVPALLTVGSGLLIAIKVAE
ncbi:MAG TPA: methyltransferase [Actinobacteria bacterium]|nr:methyltransferase [Actinomycetota bacterium]